MQRRARNSQTLFHQNLKFPFLLNLGKIGCLPILRISGERRTQNFLELGASISDLGSHFPAQIVTW